MLHEELMKTQRLLESWSSKVAVLTHKTETPCKKGTCNKHDDGISLRMPCSVKLSLRLPRAQSEGDCDEVRPCLRHVEAPSARSYSCMGVS